MNVRELSEIARLIVYEHDGFAVVQVEGEIDISNAESFIRQLKDAIAPQSEGLVVDLSTAGYIDSAGIRALFEVQSHLRQRRHELVLAVPPDSRLRKVLELTGVPGAIPTHDDVPSALAAR